MKKTLIIAVLLLISACAEQTVPEPQESVSKWQENTHYMVLDKDASATPSLYEFFSFYCPHCFQFEPLVKELKAKMSSDIRFEKIHVDFMGFATQEIQQQVSIAMIVGQHLNQEEQVNQAIFNHIHVQQKSLNNESDLSQILASVGIDSTSYQSALAEPQVQEKIKAHYDIFLQYRSTLKGVPTFIVNGKYILIFNNSMTVDDIAELIDWLAIKK